MGSHVHYRYSYRFHNSCGTFVYKHFHAVVENNATLNVLSIYYFVESCFNEMCAPNTWCVIVGDKSLVAADVGKHCPVEDIEYAPSSLLSIEPTFWMFGWTRDSMPTFSLVKTTDASEWERWHTAWVNSSGDDQQKPKLPLRF